ncbi:MAG TPA: sialidase family protein [Dehalococcoidia bacterium]|nr:sialidase family protein [Dehalococcoidia bacterium]
MERPLPHWVFGPVGANVQVSHSATPLNARSESALAINPHNALALVGASKRFIDPTHYGFTLAAYYSTDSGQTWQESPPLQLLTDPDPDKTWAGVSDPVVAWDDAGNVYLVALPFPSENGPYFTLGIAVYRSSDGGMSWSAPNFIHPHPAPTSDADDKQAVAGDTTPASPYVGRVYAAWDTDHRLSFARTTDHGATWRGVGARPVGEGLDTVVHDSFAPEIAIAPDGTVHIIWIAGDVIKRVSSTDGGESFSAPSIVASGISPLTSPPLPQTDEWTQLPGGHFRVVTFPVICAGLANELVVAWADYREGVSRVYYRRSANGGATWEGTAAGEPLLTGAVASPAGQHDFHPQLASMPDGAIGCAFYEFGAKGSPPAGLPRIDVVLAATTGSGTPFSRRALVTDQPWDPTVDAPLSHGDPWVTFIGDYFGLAASNLGFFPFWTDTRTGIQEIFTARVARHRA